MLPLFTNILKYHVRTNYYYVIWVFKKIRVTILSGLDLQSKRIPQHINYTKIPYFSNFSGHSKDLRSQIWSANSIQTVGSGLTCCLLIVHVQAGGYAYTLACVYPAPPPAS